LSSLPGRTTPPSVLQLLATGATPVQLPFCAKRARHEFHRLRGRLFLLKSTLSCRRSNSTSRQERRYEAESSCLTRASGEMEWWSLVPLGTNHRCFLSHVVHEEPNGHLWEWRMPPLGIVMRTQILCVLPFLLREVVDSACKVAFCKK